MYGEDDSLGETIREGRRNAGYTQEKLGFEVGVSANSVGKWERNEAKPSPQNRRVLARLGILGAVGGWNSVRKAGARETLSPELVGRVIRTFGCHPSKLNPHTAHPRDERTCVLVAFFEVLPVAFQDALLEIVSSRIAAEHPIPGEGRDPSARSNSSDRVVSHRVV